MKMDKIRLQNELAAQVIIPIDISEGYIPKIGDYIFTMDIQYNNDIGYVAIDIIRYPDEQIGVFMHKARVTNGYEPGFFSFREGPPLLSSVIVVTEKLKIFPNLLIIDGHGVAHPRKFGVASFLGVKTGVPTIGVAKNTLLRYEGVLEENRGSVLPIFLADEIVGNVLRTQDKTNPIFVSAGHQVHLDTATVLALELARYYKNLEPIRRADNAARLFEKGEITEGFMTANP